MVQLHRGGGSSRTAIALDAASYWGARKLRAKIALLCSAALWPTAQLFSPFGINGGFYYAKALYKF